jgi:hypothetical protein
MPFFSCGVDWYKFEIKTLQFCPDRVRSMSPCFRQLLNTLTLLLYCIDIYYSHALILPHTGASTLPGSAQPEVSWGTSCQHLRLSRFFLSDKACTWSASASRSHSSLPRCCCTVNTPLELAAIMCRPFAGTIARPLSGPILTESICYSRHTTA